MPRFAHALSAALILSAQTVWADLTPEQAWQSWQDAAKAQGQTITAKSAKQDGDTLTVTGLTLTMNSDTGKGTASLDKLQFRDKGDGSVAIVLPDSFPLHLILPPAKGSADAPVDMVLTLLIPGADITASGVPLSVNYQTSLPRLDIATDVTDGKKGASTTVSLLAKLTGVTGHDLIEAAEAGQNITEDFAIKALDLTIKVTGDAPDAAADVKLSLTDLAGKADLSGVPAGGMADFDAAMKAGLGVDLTASFGGGALDIKGVDASPKPIALNASLGKGGVALAFDASKFHYDGTASALTLNLAGTDKSSQTDYTFAGALADFTSKLDIAGQNWSGTQDFGAALKAGMTMSGLVGLGASSVDFTSATDRPTHVKAALTAANSDFAMDAGQMHYGFDSTGIATTIATPDIPLPEVAANVGELAFALQMPVAKSDTPAPFTYLTKIVDLTLPDALWAMGDPTAALPHGPTSFVIDTKGMATITRGLTEDAAALETGSDAPPGLLNALDLTQFNLKALGAEMTAAGAFTFDNSDTTTFDGVPLPTGKIDIKATGVNKLIDTLVKMGLIPKDQAMQGRMAMAMFANTSATADEITSTLEFKDKHFFANGVQMQ